MFLTFRQSLGLKCAQNSWRIIGSNLCVRWQWICVTQVIQRKPMCLPAERTVNAADRKAPALPILLVPEICDLPEQNPELSSAFATLNVLSFDFIVLLRESVAVRQPANYRLFSAQQLCAKKPKWSCNGDGIGNSQTSGVCSNVCLSYILPINRVTSKKHLILNRFKKFDFHVQSTLRTAA